MPIIIPEDIPAYQYLSQRNVFSIKKHQALKQDIRPLKILILNLMPTKIDTENQLLELLSNTPLQVDITFLKMKSYASKHTKKDHLDQFYQDFQLIKSKKFDGMIITGAPVEHLNFDEVAYWQELTQIFEYGKHHVTSTLHICWGAQAGLKYHYGISSNNNKHKLFGIYKQQKNNDFEPLLRGINDYFDIPFSTYNRLNETAMITHPALKVLGEGMKTGPSIISSIDRRHVFITGHLEYDKETLQKEYERDIRAGLKTKHPVNYFMPKTHEIKHTWKATAHLLFSNWLNYYVYQETPYRW